MEYDNLPCGGAQPDGMGVCDREVFERVWRRVMPEDRPDCPFVLDEQRTAEPLTSAAPAQAQPPAPSLPATVAPAPVQIRSAPAPCVPEENDVPCLGSASAVYGVQLQAYIDQEIADWRAYQALSRRAPGGSGRVLSTIAADERRHAKRLSTAYFLISGVRYWPADRITAPPCPAFAGALRQHFADEQRGEAAYLSSADETADPCLRELYLELAGDENSHAWLIRGILEQL